MPALTTASLGTAAAKGLRWAWDHQDEIEPKLNNLYRSLHRRLWGRQPGILILGPGGAGKTTLGRILSGKYDFLLDASGRYEQSLRVQTFRSRRNQHVELLVGPGQEDRRHATWPQLLARLSNGKELGIILCCAYGYHSLSTSVKQHKTYDSEDPDSFLQNFLADRRLEELKILQQVAGALQQNANPTWLLTLVAKEDLWTHQDQDSAVQRHYTTGEYGQAVHNYFKDKGKQAFRHEVAFGSLVIQNLVTARGETICNNTAGYDHTRQARSLRQILETVAALEDWKVKVA